MFTTGFKSGLQAGQGKRRKQMLSKTIHSAFSRMNRSIALLEYYYQTLIHTSNARQNCLCT